ncbi:hypothetical protein TcasGA2_TC003131 [Tribolium castaneum]|uniref:Uncharacterized protein n=1 Tax=Tribolium castaneum TaxID=7070 RepID=D6WF81_TRICA|nr:hypothetical protein TcasGA2_TC003131 [Tribolium castaneum]
MSHQNLLMLLSHAALAGTGIYCLLQVKNENMFCPHISFGIITINNIIGMCWCLSSYDNRIYDIFRFTSYCQSLFALPGITTSVWLANGYPKEWSWAWIITPIFPLVCYLTDAEMDMPLVDLLILFNLVGLGVVSFVKNLSYGVGATIAFALSHCYITHTTLYNYGLCFYSYFALRCLGFGQDIF